MSPIEEPPQAPESVPQSVPQSVLQSVPGPRRAWLYPLAIFGGLIGSSFVFALVLFSSLGGSGSDGEYAWTSGKGPKIGVVEVTGVITDSRAVLGHLIEFRRDKDIKAIVVRIDSPGGAVAPSQELYRAILRTRKDKKVVVSMGTVAASGGMYIAAAAEKIYALPGSITGSIGVISEFVEVDHLLDLLHVQTNTIKSGAFKDVGSPLRAMTDEDKKFLQTFTNNIYEQFLGDVADARKLDKNELRKIADGRILTGLEAKDAHLVDEIGTLEDAIEGAAKLAGLDLDKLGPPVPVFARPKRGVLGELLHDGTQGMASGLRESTRTGATVEARDPRLR